jgi:holliday junction DNA helicase RuvA
MIARLRGILDAVRADSLILDVNGVGYQVHCASDFLSRLPALGSPLSLHIETHLREDAITLYGFAEEQEREWFRLLLGVQGVGAKLALAILGVLGAAGVARAAAMQDRHAFARTSGVGPKLAGRLANELKDKAPAPVFVSAGGRTGVAPPPETASGVFADAFSALVNLGYRESDVQSALRRIEQGVDPAHQGDLSVAELVRSGLRELAHE